MKKYLLILSCGCNFAALAQNVGIGTTNPQAPLHINTAASEIVRLQAPQPYISFYNSGGGYQAYLWANGTSIDLGSAYGSGFPVTISPNVNPSTYFMPSGNVGIGISNPAERLDVGGNIKFNGVLQPGGVGGIAGQILQSNGSSTPTWISVPNIYNNTIHTPSTSTTVTLGAFATDADFPGLNRTITLSGNAKVMISYTARANSLSCFACGQSYYYYFINIDGGTVSRYGQECDNGNSKTSSQTIITQLAAGTHTIIIHCSFYGGPDLQLYGGGDIEASLDVFVIPQ